MTVRDLLKAALRHRPDRIIVGEVRGGEAFDLLQALNTGHAGSLCTLHANSARQNTIQLEDEAGSIWNYLPLGCEAQMFAIVTCRGGCGRSPHFIGVGSPLNDGKQYLLESEAWCFWCFPREHFTEEELPLIRQADRARQETKAEIIDFVRPNADWSFDDTVKPSEVVDDIRGWF